MSLNKSNNSLKLDPNSPLIKIMQQPQLMLVRHTGFSSFFKNKKTNATIQDNWRKANPHKVRRPKRQENQGLSLEMTKDEYLKQEREKNQKKK
tara:strand:- start:4622 stop:4900 length:279 start_codon:yes stop_codon:yes gene_type:complete